MSHNNHLDDGRTELFSAAKSLGYGAVASDLHEQEIPRFPGMTG